MLNKKQRQAIRDIKSTLLPGADKLPIEQRDKLIISKEDALHKAINTWFFDTYFNYEYRGGNLFEPDENEPRLTLDQYLQKNSMQTLLTGIGKNHFVLNEHMDTEQTILSFKTLLDYDMDQHAQNQLYRINEPQLPEHKKVEPYTIQLSSVWARAFLNKDNKKRFYYLTLQSGHSTVSQTLSDTAMDLIHELIPHEFVPGPTDGQKTEEGYITWDRQPDAGGLERELEILKLFAREQLLIAQDEITSEFQRVNLNCIWIKDTSEINNDPSLLYIFSDEQSLNVRFTHWQEDTEAKQTLPYSEFERIEAKYKQKLINSLTQKFNEFEKTNHTY